ncbi:hypothetical protein GLAREA_04336 [Glarea lozoyensis ATCC 20868]|uniref:Interferon alpha-inducible protein 27, mitochondrial n=1 Tax=Glarea lozoyensis (strain ATCC 20868 / MF5171) TaxID=1116229 RepID=S3CPA7_GLAL2|nr:uncharacterized protein GLAREA_04336 [Glarea lozoyensis ATCC 20868]EPE27545.1 hypothetical protein GLAREA_04336 [Glarea lozoyensis ATCC 20868]
MDKIVGATMKAGEQLLPLANTAWKYSVSELGKQASRISTTVNPDIIQSIPSIPASTVLTSAQVIGVGTATVAIAALAAPAALGVVGFSAIGPVGGSIAAGLQASYGAVPAGSVFALCQSVAMGGTTVAGTSTALIAAGGGGVAVVAGALKG